MGDQGRTMENEGSAATGFGRRRFLGYVLAAPTLVVAAQFEEAVLAPDRAAAAGLSVPEPSQIYDLTDMLTDATLPTSGLISIAVEVVMPWPTSARGSANEAVPSALSWMLIRPEVGRVASVSMSVRS
jgi:hypothetical protein